MTTKAKNKAGKSRLVLKKESVRDLSTGEKVKNVRGGVKAGNCTGCTKQATGCFGTLA